MNVIVFWKYILLHYNIAKLNVNVMVFRNIVFIIKYIYLFLDYSCNKFIIGMRNYG